jgi:nucleosome assembly protein 1-like 1
LEEKLEMDYQIGEDIKEKIIPKAVDYFTGKALEYDMMEEDDDDFEDVDEDDEDEDDEDDEDDDEDVKSLFPFLHHRSSLVIGI